MTARIRRLYNAKGTDFIEVIYIETETGTFVQAVGGGQVITNQPVPDTNPYVSTLTTQGDLLVGAINGSEARIPIGTEGQILAVVDGIPTWIDPVISVAQVYTTLFTFEGSLLATNSPIRFYNTSGTNRTITKVFTSVNTAPTGASIIIDLHKSGTTIFTTQTNRPEILATAFTAQSTTIESATWADGEYLMLYVDQVGSTVSGSDLTVQVSWS